ncbi:conserved phage C-terminal domain-containing protein [Bacillus wiedmannii]|uniref:conserved phage C-terminal domain-containing protein n=1 Tax=Bacillus wiedmannii TaxID=1890302 RepID=UPI0007CADC80|nr:conserved phage C-terminal domain-containing protein [Bacillus wiedmannii]OAK35885.1 phage replication protein [Bacillus wiedmannii]HDR7640773.1 conserved phage C-terminal domain-containing protein [Bacillus wiedmannii]
MATFRVSKDKNYTTINNTGLRDERLTWKAKGILAYILSLPDDWVFYMEEVATHSKDKLDSLKSGIKELKEHGYVKRYPVKNEKGKIARWEMIIYEVPQGEYPLVENPQMEKPLVDKPLVENPPLLSTKELSTNKSNTDKQNNTMSSSNEEDNQSLIPYEDIVSYLNEKASKSFKHKTAKTRTLINARFKDGFTIDDFKQVIDIKTAQWLTDSNMNQYLRPETLFGTKFEGYLNEKGAKNYVGNSNAKGSQIPGFKGELPF